MTLFCKWNTDTSIEPTELNGLVSKYEFLSFSEDWEYIIIKTRNPNKKDLKIHKNDIKLRKIIKKQIPIIWKKSISKEQQELNRVKNYLKRLLENKKAEYENKEKLINLWISKLGKLGLDSKEFKKAVKSLKQSINSILLNS